MTTNQNKTVHALFYSTGLLPHKKNIIGGISFGRTESSKDLSIEEGNMLIAYLQNEANNSKYGEAANKMRRKIISMAHQLHWYLPNSQKIDMERINNWCLQYGHGHKKLNDYTGKELPTLVTQFKAVFASVLTNI